MSEIIVQVVPKGAATGDLSSVPLSTEPFLNRVDEIGEGLGEIAKRLRAKIDTVMAPAASAEKKWKLDELELTFSFDLESEVGFVIARGKAKAGFEASLTWKANSPTA